MLLPTRLETGFLKGVASGELIDENARFQGIEAGDWDNLIQISGGVREAVLDAERPDGKSFATDGLLAFQSGLD